jgi:transposase-like protein
MARIARKSDGRRIFPAEFKREHIGRVLRGELTLAELSRKLGIARSLLQRWKRLAPQEADPANAIRWPAGPPGGPREVGYIRELQLLVGKQALELELLRGELDALRKGQLSRGTPGR